MDGCLLIHGFTGSEFEVEPLTIYLRERGINAVCPLLAGHGDQPEKSLKEVVWQDWVHSAEVALQDLQNECETIYVVGFSMGGLIAGYLANRYRVDKLVLLSASVFYLNPKQLAKDLVALMQSLLKHPERLQDFRRYSENIKTIPLQAVIEFCHLVRALKPELADIRVPTLIVQGALDDLVDPRSATYIYETIQSTEKQLHILPKSKHIVCHDCEKEELKKLVGNFLNIDE